jgi:hypothetical protein
MPWVWWKINDELKGFGRKLSWLKWRDWMEARQLEVGWRVTLPGIDASTCQIQRYRHMNPLGAFDRSGDSWRWEGLRLARMWAKD